MKKEMVVTMSILEYMRATGAIYNMSCEKMYINDEELAADAELKLVLSTVGELRKEKISDKQEKIKKENQMSQESRIMFG